jgi:hypothetical protein
MKKKHIIRPVLNSIDYISITNADDAVAKEKYYLSAAQWERLREQIAKLYTPSDDVEDEARDESDLEESNERHLVTIKAVNEAVTRAMHDARPAA